MTWFHFISSQERKVALVEYSGTFPDATAQHGNARNFQAGYFRTDPKILKAIVESAKHQPPRKVYDELTANVSIEAPRDFKQIQSTQHKETTRQSYTKHSRRGCNKHGHGKDASVCAGGDLWEGKPPTVCYML